VTWVPGAADSPYNIHNLPFGVFSTADVPTPRIGVRIGDYVLDMHKAVLSGDCQTCASCTALRDPALNRFLSLGRPTWQEVRLQVQQAVTEPSLQDAARGWLTPLAEARMHAPLLVTDFVDFNTSEAHAANMGRILRPGTEPLPASWRFHPQAQHGRASTVIPSGMELVRPSGNRREPGGDVSFGPTRSLDLEAEVGFIVGSESELGRPLSPDTFEEHVFGVVLVNDWTARDFAAFESDPLGPFTATSFATSMSAWVTPLEALGAARTAAPTQDVHAPSYLKESDRFGYDVQLAVEVNGQVLSRPRLGGAYWTPAQLLAQLTANGAVLRPGMLFGSGAVSGTTREQAGTLMEMTWGGEAPVAVGGQRRVFVEDGDLVRITATAPGPRGTTIALGEVATRVTGAIG
jgi:fumarylacetoacetase